MIEKFGLMMIIFIILVNLFSFCFDTIVDIFMNKKMRKNYEKYKRRHK